MSETVDPIADNQPTQDDIVSADVQSQDQAVELSGFASMITDPELAKDPSLAVFKDPDGIAKSFVEQKKFLGNSIQLPKEPDDQEGWNKVWTKLGVPESADDYEVEEREFNGVKFNKETSSDFLQFAKENNIPKDVVKKIVDFDYQRQTTAYDGLMKSREEEGKTQHEALKKSLEGGYDQAEKNIFSTIEKLTNEKDSAILKSEAIKSPALFNLLKEVSKNYSEDSLENITVDSDVTTQTDAKEEYNRMLADKESPLHDPGHEGYAKAQEKHLRLFKKANGMKG